MEKMRMESVDLTTNNIEKIEKLFPNCITESTDENGKLKKAINFELLKQMLSSDVIEGNEAYEFTWVGKKASIVEANKHIRKTLRPCIDESVEWDKTENLYIEGDNLEVLKLFQESYLSKIKMIYIDPPYNTGNDFIYNDNFKIGREEYSNELGENDNDGNRMFKNTESNGRYHSDWCSMMYSRLLLSRNILKPDGCIFISINDIEVTNLRKMCDEIFGTSNFVADLIWTNNEGGGSSDSKYFRIKHEHIICYAKDIGQLEITGVNISNADRYKGEDEYINERGPYYLQKLGMGSIQYSPSLDYPIETPDGCLVTPSDNNRGRKSCWRWSKEKFYKNKQKGFVEMKKDSQGIWIIYSKQYMNCDNEGNLINRTQRPMGIIDNYSSIQAAKMLESFGLGRLFNYSKPVELLKYLIHRIDLDNEYILDFFSGSASTAHAVMELNQSDNKMRKFIMVQLPEKTDELSEAFRAGYHNICEIGMERIRRAGKKILEDNKDKAEIRNLDIGFRVLKLDDSNMTDVYYNPSEYSQDLLSSLESNVKPDRTDLDLLFGCLLEWGLPLSLPYKSEQIDGCTVHNYNNGDLIACFDEDIPESVIKEIAKKQPLRAVFRDSSFANSPSKINVGEIFKLMAPDTRVKVI